MVRSHFGGERAQMIEQISSEFRHLNVREGKPVGEPTGRPPCDTRTVHHPRRIGSTTVFGDVVRKR
jgi:hypothetical protein